MYEESDKIFKNSQALKSELDNLKKEALFI